MPNDAEVQRALDEGARRSREASELTGAERAEFESVTVGVTRHKVDAMASSTDGPPRYAFSLASGVAITPEYLWRRFKWPIIALGLFLLIELISMGKLISVMGTKF